MTRPIQTYVNIHMERLNVDDEDDGPRSICQVANLPGHEGTVTIEFDNANGSYGGVCLFTDRRSVEALQKVITDYLETAETAAGGR